MSRTGYAALEAGGPSMVLPAENNEFFRYFQADTLNGSGQITVRMSGHHGKPETAGALRHRRGADPLGKEPLSQQSV